jgi:DNA repair protein REV1
MQDMKALVVANGSKLREAMASDVTIIIATQMSASKMNQLKQPVVKPEWVHACVEANKLLDWREYRVFDTKGKGQMNLNFQDIGTKKIPTTTMESQELDDDVTERQISPYKGQRNPSAPLDLSDEWIRSVISSSPGFIDKYFASSRLHHLSTWKQEFCELVRKSMHSLHKRQPYFRDDAVIMHVDMDCFFASVAVRKRPDLTGKPIAIAHSLQGKANSAKNSLSTSEVACVNYEARQFGIKNGSFLGDAMDKCPELTVLPYDYDEINACSKIIYDILIKCSDYVQAVSCDEVYIDLTKSFEASGNTSRQQWCLNFAHEVRREIHDTTGCNASIGIGNNMLQARLATGKAKPNNAYCIDQCEVETFLKDFPIRQLPGVGYSTSSKLEELGITTCGPLSSATLSSLREKLGEKTGQTLFEFCRGIDRRVLENKPRMHVGAEINWAIRFENDHQVSKFIADFCGHVSARCAKSNFVASQLTVKAKRRDYGINY